MSHKVTLSSRSYIILPKRDYPAQVTLSSSSDIVQPKWHVHPVTLSSIIQPQWHYPKLHVLAQVMLSSPSDNIKPTQMTLPKMCAVCRPWLAQHQMVFAQPPECFVGQGHLWLSQSSLSRPGFVIQPKGPYPAQYPAQAMWHYPAQVTFSGPCDIPELKWHSAAQVTWSSPSSTTRPRRQYPAQVTVSSLGWQIQGLDLHSQHIISSI